MKLESTENIESLDETSPGQTSSVEAVRVEGTELEEFAPAEIERVDFVDEDRVISILEGLLFATDRPVTLATMKQAFKGTSVQLSDLRRALEILASDYAHPRRGFSLEEVAGGYQLRTKVDNVEFLRKSVKPRPFRLSGPALEVLSIVAYKQPIPKSEVDQIRGVESGHLLRALMEKHLVGFGGKSDLPGRPMYYETTRRFLEVFGLRNIKELPSLQEIDQLIPDGIGVEDQEEAETLDSLTSQLSEEAPTTYSDSEDELLKITEKLSAISTTTEFFEEEKRKKREAQVAESHEGQISEASQE